MRTLGGAKALRAAQRRQQRPKLRLHHVNLRSSRWVLLQMWALRLLSLSYQGGRVQIRFGVARGFTDEISAHHSITGRTQGVCDKASTSTLPNDGVGLGRRLHVDQQVADQVRHAVPQVPHRALGSDARVPRSRVAAAAPRRAPRSARLVRRAQRSRTRVRVLLTRAAAEAAQRRPRGVQVGGRAAQAQQEAEQRGVHGQRVRREQQVQRPGQAVLQAQAVPGVVRGQVQGRTAAPRLAPRDLHG